MPSIPTVRAVAPLLPLLALLPTAAAQVPAESALVLELQAVGPGPNLPAFKLLDVLGRHVTTVRSQSVYSPMASVAIDPTDAARVFYETNGASLGGTWSTSIRGLAAFGTSAWGSLGLAASQRVEAGAQHVFTLRAGQVFFVPKGGGANQAFATVADAVDLAVADPTVFVLTYVPGAAAPLLAIDVPTRNVRTVGSYPGARAIAVLPGGLLLLGTDTGAVLTVDPNSGAVIATGLSNASSITAIAATRFGTAVYTDGAQVWSDLVPTPLYSSPTGILDLAMPRTPGPSLLPYGAGCAASGTVEWSFDSQPRLGSPAFRIGMQNGTPGSTAILALGFGFTFSSFFGQALPVALQPFGLGSCMLWADPLLQAGVPLNASGAGSVIVPIPADPALAGLELGMQWVAPQAGANPAGLVVGEAVMVQLF